MMRMFSVDVEEQGVHLNGQAHASLMIFSAGKHAGESVRAGLIHELSKQKAGTLSDEVRTRLLQTLSQCSRIMEQSPFTFVEGGVTVTITPTRMPGCLDAIGFDITMASSEGHGWG